MIGQPGKKYGLVVPKKPGAATRARPMAAPKRPPGAAFSLDDDDDDEAERDDLSSKESFNAMLKVSNMVYWYNKRHRAHV